MKAHAILGIEASASRDEIEQAYLAKLDQLGHINAENDDELRALDYKRTQLLEAKKECLKYKDTPILQRVVRDAYMDISNPNKLRSCSCIPPGIGWCCAKVCDSCVSTCCCNDNPDAYNTCGEPVYEGMEPSCNWFKVADALGWICCIIFAFPFISEIAESIKSSKDRKQREKDQIRIAQEAERLRKQKEEEQKRLAAERIKKQQEHDEVDKILVKTYDFYQQMKYRRDNVYFAMSLFYEITADAELGKVITAYDQQLREDANSLKLIIEELRKKEPFVEGYDQFKAKYGEMIDFVEAM